MDKTIDLHSTFSAKIWAEEFCKVYKGMNEDFMTGWFDNAIMAGYDYAKREIKENTEIHNSITCNHCVNC